VRIKVKDLLKKKTKEKEIIRNNLTLL